MVMDRKSQYLQRYCCRSCSGFGQTSTNYLHASHNMKVSRVIYKNDEKIVSKYILYSVEIEYNRLLQITTNASVIRDEKYSRNNDNSIMHFTKIIITL